MNQDFSAKIGANIKEFTRKMREIDRKVRKTAMGATKPIDANIKKFRAKLAEVEALSKSMLHKEDKEIGADISEFMRKAAQLMTVAKAMERRPITVRIQARIENFQNKLSKIATTMRSFGEVSAATFQGIGIAISSGIVPVIATLTSNIMTLGAMLGTVGGSTFALASAFATAGIGAAGFGAIAVTNLKGVFGASEELKKLNEKLAQADTEKQRLKILKDIEQVQASINKEQAKALKAMDNLKSTWSDIAGAYQSETIDIFTRTLGLLEKVLVRLKPMFAGVMDAAMNLMSSLEKTIDSKPLQDFFNYLNKSAGPMMETVTKAVGEFVQGVLNMMVAFGPLAQATADGFLKMGQGFADWAAGLSESKKFESFVNYVNENMPKIRSIFSDAIQGIINIFAAFAPSSADMMTSLEDMMERFKEWSANLSQNEGFKKFITYIQENAPKVGQLIGNITDFLVNLGIALAPMGSKVLDMVNGFLEWTNAMMESHPMVGKIIAVVITLAGMLLAIIPNVIAFGTLFAGSGAMIAKAATVIGSAATVMSSRFLLSMGSMIKSMYLTTSQMIITSAKFIARWVLMGAQALIHAARVAAAWTLTTGAAMARAVALMIVAAAQMIARWALMAGQALLHAARFAAAWLLTTGAAMARAVAQMIATAAIFVARWTWMAVQALAQAARMAAAWFIALGPIGWVTAAIIALAILIIANWDKISTWTKNTWNKVWTWIKDTWSKIKAGTIAGAQAILSTVITKFASIVSNVSSKMTAAKNYVSNKWQEAKSAAQSKLSSMLTSVISFFTRIGTNVSTKMTAAKNYVTNKWEEAKSAARSKLSEMLSSVGTFFTNIVSKVREKLSEAVRIVGQKIGEMPGKVRGFVSDMISAGSDLVSGLISGIKNMGSAAIESIAGVVGGVVDKAKNLLKIKSPSRVMMEIGKFVGQGLAKGVTGTSKQVTAAGASLASKITKAIQAKTTTLKQKAALRNVQSYANQQISVLNNVAKQRESLATKIKAAGEKLNDALKVRNDFAKSVKESAMSFASVSNIDAKTDLDLSTQLKNRLAAIKAFQADVTRLQKAGLNNTTLRDIVDAGVEKGGAQAAMLAKSSTDIIKEINNTQAAINKASSSFGNSTANQFYGLGVDAAQGMVKGLESQAKALEASANKISQSLIKAVKKKLDIHSPSRVFAALGRYVTRGLAVGVADRAKVAIKAISAVAQDMTRAFAPKLAMAEMQANATLTTNIKRADLQGVKHSFSADINELDLQQPDTVLMVDGKELGKVVAKPVKEENERYENMVRIGRGRR
ncbi:phage tail protein [Jeotgalibacillus proteolyticus]|uniref:Phage tail tape measure protein n=1 Tax=Jeotgalibacillus proteolyticus TaxID=2082395 RepID=A0A2S5GB73_9BACL|nr:hypothetical protein [Jeotgalibacillus proteolyticus]PPA70175.1 hypothetical protein C4B60_11350 [Jeotgalibacillus proteolyticus]